MDCHRIISIFTIQLSDAASTAKTIVETLDRMFGSPALPYTEHVRSLTISPSSLTTPPLKMSRSRHTSSLSPMLTCLSPMLTCLSPMLTCLSPMLTCLSPVADLTRFRIGKHYSFICCQLSDWGNIPVYTYRWVKIIALIRGVTCECCPLDGALVITQLTPSLKPCLSRLFLNAIG